MERPLPGGPSTPCGPHSEHMAHRGLLCSGLCDLLTYPLPLLRLKRPGPGHTFLFLQLLHGVGLGGTGGSATHKGNEWPRSVPRGHALPKVLDGTGPAGGLGDFGLRLWGLRPEFRGRGAPATPEHSSRAWPRPSRPSSFPGPGRGPAAGFSRSLPFLPTSPCHNAGQPHSPFAT